VVGGTLRPVTPECLSQASLSASGGEVMLAQSALTLSSHFSDGLQAAMYMSAQQEDVGVSAWVTVPFSDDMTKVCNCSSNRSNVDSEPLGRVTTTTESSIDTCA